MIGQSSHHSQWCRQSGGNLTTTRARLEKRTNPRHIYRVTHTCETHKEYCSDGSNPAYASTIFRKWKIKKYSREDTIPLHLCRRMYVLPDELETTKQKMLSP